MSLIFSRQSEYAIQALIYLAKKTSGQWTSIKEIAEQLNIPQHFLGKIMQSLSMKRMLNSQKGLFGGFELAKSSEEIFLFDIVEAIDGDGYRTSCVLGFPNCSGNSPCPVHDDWKELRDNIVEMIKKKNLLELANEITKPGYKSL
ncbi:MAG: Rrf2 family transcriptional regulator [Bacteroidota bacterium]|nr:Rrf2 family transcriptional regulator [Bacteroidota bacterium]